MSGGNVMRTHMNTLYNQWKIFTCKTKSLSINCCGGTFHVKSSSNSVWFDPITLGRHSFISSMVWSYAFRAHILQRSFHYEQHYIDNCKGSILTLLVVGLIVGSIRSSRSVNSFNRGTPTLTLITTSRQLRVKPSFVKQFIHDAVVYCIVFLSE